MNAKQERIKRVYPPLKMRIVFEVLKYIFEHVSIDISIEKQKIVRRFTKEIKAGVDRLNTTRKPVIV